MKIYESDISRWLKGATIHVKPGLKNIKSITPYHELVTTQTASSILGAQFRTISEAQAEVR